MLKQPKCRTDAGVALLLTTPGHLPLTVFSAFNLKERSSNPQIPGAWDRSGNYFFKFCGDPGEMGPYHNPSEVMPRKESVRHIWELSNMIFELHSCLCEACTITIPILWLSKPSLGALKKLGQDSLVRDTIEVELLYSDPKLYVCKSPVILAVVVRVILATAVMIYVPGFMYLGGSEVKNLSAVQESCYRGFDPQIRKIPWRRKW